MSLITITSDWSKNDYYSALLKGKILSYDRESVIVEISNQIDPLDVIQSQFILKHSFESFPKGTIHLMCVDSESSSDNPMVIVLYKDYYFVGVNDGRFVYLMETLPSVAYALKQPAQFSTFMAADQFVEAIKIINSDSFIRETERVSIKEEPVMHPVCAESSIIGRVIYIDSFGNAITNISKTLFTQQRGLRDFEIFVQGPFAKTASISHSYDSVPPGSMVAIFNSLGQLEIAINKGNLAQTEGLSVSAEIMIKFL